MEICKPEKSIQASFEDARPKGQRQLIGGRCGVLRGPAGGDRAGSGHAIGVGARSTEFVASRLFPVIVIRPQMRTLPQPD
jgi:hypothetical protein